MKKINVELLPLQPDDREQFILDNWREVEKLHPEVKVRGTVTPYSDKRNIHFYVNRCGFHIVESCNSHLPDPGDPDTGGHDPDEQFPEGMFRSEKIMPE